MACEGDSFSFQTLADSINLYFMGTNTVMPVEIEAVSYTHLDVYKRQLLDFPQIHRRGS